jgi:hypothetical protein
VKRDCDHIGAEFPCFKDYGERGPLCDGAQNRGDLISL